MYFFIKNIIYADFSNMFLYIKIQNINKKVYVYM
jgi:hypothetical protein